jgi:hypothetical protein
LTASGSISSGFLRLDLETHFLDPGEAPMPVGIEGVEDAEAVLKARIDALKAAASHAL